MVVTYPDYLIFYYIRLSGKSRKIYRKYNELHFKS